MLDQLETLAAVEKEPEFNEDKVRARIFLYETVALAFIDVAGTPGTQELEHSEDITVVLADYDEVCRLCNDTSAKFDVKLWTVMFLYQQLGRLE